MTTPTAHTRARSEYRDFLAAITASPLDDGVRLVFADWLDEQGDADRAAYIRMEIERATLPEFEDRALLLKYEADALLQRHWREWVADLPEWMRPSAAFERGLPGRISAMAGDILASQQDDWTCVPVHHLAIGDNTASTWGDVLVWPELSRLTSLRVRFAGMSAADIAALARCPHLSGLRHLDLGWSDIDTVGIQALAAATFASLTELGLGSSPVGATAAEALARAPFLPRLTGLDLFGCSLSEGSLRALLDGPVDNLRDLDLRDFDGTIDLGAIRVIAECPRLAGLRRLRLGEVLQNENDLFALAASPYLTAIEMLDMATADEWRPEANLDAWREIAHAPIIQRLTEFSPWFTPFGDAEAQLTADWPAFANVRRLVLDSSDAGPNGLQALLASPFLTRVNILELSRNAIGDQGVALFANSPWLPRLRILELEDTGVTVAGVRALIQGDTSRLLRLVLGENQLGDAGTAALAEGNWPALRELRLFSAGVGSTGAAALAGPGVFPNVIELYLSGNAVGPAGAEAIANGEGLASLLRLHLADNGIGDVGATALANSPRRLSELDVRENGIDPTIVERLKNSEMLAGARSVRLS